MTSNNNQIISYLTQRKLLGYLGIGLPFLVFLGSQLDGLTSVQNSISAYYFLNVREIFVATLAALALFFVTYKGYNNTDKWLTNVAGFLAINIAIFPSMRETTETIHYLFTFITPNVTDIIHLISASSFFAILAYISCFVFTKTGDDITLQKIKRNRLYKICGTTIFASLVIMGVVEILPQAAKDWLHAFRPIFVFESISLFAFGISWLVKGELFLADK